MKRRTGKRGAPVSQLGMDLPEQEPRTIPAGWDQYIHDAVELEWYTSRSYGPQYDEKAFYKRQAADRGLIDGRIEVRLDATIAGVDVPKRFRGTRELCLAMTLNDPVDTTTDEVGIRATLSFEGSKYACVLPWKAIWAISTERGAACWREDMPPDVAKAIYEAESTPAPAPPPKVYVPDPVIGPAVDQLMSVVGAAYTAHKQAQMEEWERAEAAEPRPQSVAPGDLFRFTGRALQSMYGVGGFGMCKAPDERWTAVACECGLCASGRFVAIDTGRHFARGNVERCLRAVAQRGAPVDADAFLAAERAQLGVDRVAGTVVDPRCL